MPKYEPKKRKIKRATGKEEVGQDKASAIEEAEKYNNQPIHPASIPLAGTGDDKLAKIRVKNLPSHLVSYPHNAEIYYRPYTWGEIKIYSGSKNLSMKENLDFVMKGIYTNFDKMQLTLSDVLYLGFLRKLSNDFGKDKINVIYLCPHCKESTESTVLHANIEFDEISIDKPYIKVDLDSGPMWFKPFTISAYYRLIESKLEQNKITSLAYMANNEYDKRSIEELYDILLYSHIDDGIVLDEIDNLLYHGLKPIDVECSKCKKHSPVELDGSKLSYGGKVIIRPFRKSNTDVRSRIHIGG